MRMRPSWKRVPPELANLCQKWHIAVGLLEWFGGNLTEKGCRNELWQKLCCNLG